ncbi:phosphatidylserine/phosphatidylglycerophosphate/cardiolipin synthase family protein [Flagellimonas sp. 389]|uniref:phospholipase D-like domain-containing protein n=1 Tax=Flagellimonas sp. 389 TaxID=2835862 RepID=UPI001BD5B68C|nr:hypothetical protein [Flagellimonas sp. 389]
MTDSKLIEKSLSSNYKRLSQLIANSGHTLPYSGNLVKVLDDGDETFDTIFEVLDKAKKFIHIQYYAFEQGELQEKFYEILKRKTKEGFEVRLIYDKLFQDFFYKKHQSVFTYNFGNITYPV